MDITQDAIQFTMINGVGQQVVSAGSFMGVLSWTDEDPLAVTVTFHGDASNGAVPWTFSLDVLADGLHSYQGSGVGDINVRTTGRYVLIELSAGCENCQRYHTQASMRCDRDVVARFYDRVRAQPAANVLPMQVVDQAIERILETTPWR